MGLLHSFPEMAEHGSGELILQLEKSVYRSLGDNLSGVMDPMEEHSDSVNDVEMGNPSIFISSCYIV